MSRIFFHFLAPAFIALAILVFAGIAPQFRQQVLLDFAVIYYLLILYSYYKFGRQTAPAPELTPQKRGGGISEDFREIVLREYEYVQETMAQAMNDRHTLVNYFLLATGVVMATIGAVYSTEGMFYSPYKNHLTIAICLTLSIVAWIYFLKIVRLRQAWCDSCAAMNRIKQFFLVNEGLSDGDERSPFLWKSNTIPRADRKGNLFHLEAILINFISSLAVAAVSVLLLPTDSWRMTFWIPAGFFLLFLALQFSAYTVFLKEKKAKGAAAAPQKLHVLDSTHQPRQVVLHEERLAFDGFFKIKKAVLQFEKFDGRLSEKVEQLSFMRGYATAILLYDEAAHEFIFIEQFRYPYFEEQRTKGWMIEIVAGMVDHGESPREAAQRETMEETGFACEEVKPLAEFYVSPGSSSERIAVFWGKLGKKISEGGGKKSENENIRLVRMPVAEAFQKLERGEFQDAKTIIALLHAKPLLMRV